MNHRESQRNIMSNIENNLFSSLCASVFIYSVFLCGYNSYDIKNKNSSPATMGSLFFKIAFIILLALSSCISNENSKNNKKVFRYNESKNIATLDPAFARNQAAIWPINQLYNGLLQLNDSLHIKPCIAKNWSISKDGKLYTFHLRSDVYFHDHNIFPGGKGRKVNAHDFEFSFSRLIDPVVASPGAWVFNFVDERHTGSNKGFKAINDSTLQIYLKSPFPAFTGILTMPYCFVVPAEVVNHYGRDFRSHPVGTGPFKFKIWAEGEKLVLVKNENYFEKDTGGTRLPKIDAVAVTFIADKQSEFLEFIKGRLDFISGVNASFKDELITAEGKLQKKYSDRMHMLTCPYLNIEFLGILADTSLLIVENSILRNKLVRQAINLAIDRKKMVSYLRNNIGTAAYGGFVPEGLPGYIPGVTTGYEYNPDSAIKLLKKAGYFGGTEMQPIKIITVSDYADLCEYIQNELALIGITVEVETVTGLSYREMLANSRINLFRASWIADYPDAENYMALFYSRNFSPKGPNYTHFCNKQFDKLYEKALLELSDVKRIGYYYQMEQILHEEAVTIPLFYDMAVRFTQKNIVNLGINPMNLLTLKYVEVK
jgi:oligopeptide transport system substrate-binding protein